MNGDLDRGIEELSAKHPDFGNYRADVLKYTRSLPMDQRNPNVMEAAYFFIKGQKANDLLERERQTILARIQAGEQVQGLTPGAGTVLPPESKPKLTEDQIKAAGAMGMSPEEYLKNMR